jgi:hypothetical protein
MKRKISFNLNEYVYVKLTPTGLAELEREHNELRSAIPSVGEYKPPTCDSNGFVKFQLWYLANRFGHLLTMGFDVPFETTIEIEVDNELTSGEIPKDCPLPDKEEEK